MSKILRMARQALGRCKAVLTCMLLLKNAWKVFPNLCQWTKKTWCERVDVETTRCIQPGMYPDRMADLHLELGLARLIHQHTQAAVFDNKLAVAGSLSLAITALVPIAFARSFSPTMLASITGMLVAAGLILLLIASLSSIKGLWPRTYRSLPDLLEVRNQIGEDYTDQDIRWSIAVSLEQAIDVNERVMAVRAATVKLVYILVVLGLILFGIAFLFRHLS